MGWSHISVSKGAIFLDGRWIPGCRIKGGIFWEGGVDYGSVANSGEEGGIFWRDG